MSTSITTALLRKSGPNVDRQDGGAEQPQAAVVVFSSGHIPAIEAQAKAGKGEHLQCRCGETQAWRKPPLATAISTCTGTGIDR